MHRFGTLNGMLTDPMMMKLLKDLMWSGLEPEPHALLSLILTACSAMSL